MSFRAAPMMAVLVGLAACANAEDRVPPTDTELATVFLSSLAAKDNSKLQLYAARDLDVRHVEKASSLGELLDYIDAHNCSVTDDGPGPEIAESKVVTGTRPYQGVLMCGERGTFSFGVMNVELSINRMRVSSLNWYLLTLGA